MNRSRLAATFIVALIIAGAAGLLVLKKLKQTARASASSHRVVVTARDVEIGSKLTEMDLKMASWSSGSPPQGSFTDPKTVLGRAVLYPLFRDEPVLEAKLAAEGSGAGMSAVIPQGMRAVSIRVDDVVAVAGFVGPGTKVDVLLTGAPASVSGRVESLTKTILENVQVLAAGQKIQPDAQGRPETVNVVTLLCTPEAAAKVTLAANDGRIQLVLRNPTDKLLAQKEALVFRRALYGDSAPSAPAPVRRREIAPPPAPATPPPPPPPPPPTTALIEMVRGERVSKVEIILSPSSGETNP